MNGLLMKPPLVNSIEFTCRFVFSSRAYAADPSAIRIPNLETKLDGRHKVAVFAVVVH